MDKVRYAVVGAGWISQEAFLPGVATSGNSVADVAIMRALEAAAVTGRPQPVDLPQRPAHPDASMVRMTRPTHQRRVF